MNPSFTDPQNAEQFMAQFDAFKPRYEAAREAADIAARQSAPGFNIFQWLGEHRFEDHYHEHFHSDFIAYLLDPRSNHGQRHLFLKTFFQSIKPHLPELKLPDGPLNHGIWQVECEVFTRYGYLDIALRNPALKAFYIIENKVDAAEQVDQILRYITYLEGWANEYPHQGLLFLTLDGHVAKSAGGKTHHPIAYHAHIRAWLESALPQIEAATVRETVQQYLELIRSL